MLVRGLDGLVVGTVQDHFLGRAGEGRVEVSEEFVARGVEREAAVVHDVGGELLGGLEVLLGVSVDVADGLHGLVGLVVDVPGALEEHAAGGDGADDELVHVVRAVIGADVVEGVVEVLEAGVHDQGAGIAVLVHVGLVVGGDHVVVVRHVTEGLDETAVLPAAEEACHAVPVVVLLVGEASVLLHHGQTVDQEVPLADVGEVPRAGAAALQPVAAVAELGTVPVVGRERDEDVGLRTGGGTVVTHLIGVAGGSVHGTPVVGVAAEVGSVRTVDEEADVALGRPVGTVVHAGEGIAVQELVRVAAGQDQRCDSHQDV